MTKFGLLGRNLHFEYLEEPEDEIATNKLQFQTNVLLCLDDLLTQSDKF